jgi:MFS family permease
MIQNNLVRAVTENIKNAVVCTIAFALGLAGGSFLLLVVVSVIGYLPYSDRPGPGWYGGHLPNLHEIAYYGSWAAFFVGPFALIWGVLLFVFVRTLGWFAAPKWFVRTISAVFASFVSLLGLTAAGWYIALSAVVVYGGAAVGAIFGGWVLPRFTGAVGPIRNTWVRWTAIAAIILVSFGLVLYPILPDRNAQSLDVVIKRLVPGPDAIDAESGLRKGEIEVLNSLGLKGILHGGIQIASGSSGSGEKHARVLIAVRERLTSKVTLRQPKATDVVYVQDGNEWRMYPRGAPTLRKKITLTEGTGDLQGLTVQVDPVIGKGNTFTWYPPIEKIQP